LTTALPLSNMGRFWSSTIWIIRPSCVISVRICERYSFSAHCWQSCVHLGLERMQALGIACGLFGAAHGLAGAAVGIVFGSERRTWPCTLDRSLPPPGTMLELLPAPLPPDMATFSGELKYAAMPCSSP
jgi:hypothetical protein